MSNTLKNAVPLAALSGSRVFLQPSKPDLSVSIGWKKSAIESASASLLAAAGRLSTESGETSKFVESVLRIRAAGWTIVQMPAGAGESRTGVLKVFYGFQKGRFLHRLGAHSSWIRLSGPWNRLFEGIGVWGFVI
jgi:hypothetical protein